MFGFGKKSNKPKKQKAVEFEIVTMESASEDAPQTIVLNPEEEKSKKEDGGKEERELLKREKTEERERRKQQKVAEEEERGQIKIEKEKARLRKKELQLEEGRKEEEAKAQKELEKTETRRKEKELELKKHEEELEQKQAQLQQKKLEEELDRNRTKQEEGMKKQKQIEKQTEKQEKLREKEVKEQARLEKIQHKQEKLKQEQARLEEEVEKEVPSQPQAASPFLTEKETEQVERQKTNAKVHEQAYAQALSTQRSEEIKEIAKEELERRQRLFAGRVSQQEPLATESPLSSALANKEVTKTKKVFLHEDTEEKSIAKPKTQSSRTSFNKPLLSIAFLVLLVTLAAGAYYYFFVIKAPGEEWTPIEIPEITLPLQREDTETTPETNDDDFSPVLKSNILKKASLRSINPETFDKDLEKLISTLKSSPARSQTLQQGMFVKLAKANGQPIETKTLLILLGIDNQQLHELSKDEIWLFLVKQQQNTLSEEASVININLVISLSSKEEIADLEGSVMLFEQDLPAQCLGLFIDEEKPTIQEKISFQTTKTDSKVIPQTRFFNYEAGNSRKSVDWSIARYIDQNYLVISTSKNSTDKLLEAMK